MPSFEHFNSVISPKLSLANLSLSKRFLLTLLAAKFQITSGYLSLLPCALFAIVVLKLFP
jgi:hypothetical protein